MYLGGVLEDAVLRGATDLPGVMVYMGALGE